MGLPKLEITKPDVETAIGIAFRKQFSDLTFIPKLKVVGIDGNILVSLNREFDGKGIYPVSIYGSLLIPIEDVDATMTQRYSLHVKVAIDSTSENEPIVAFESPVSAQKMP